MDVTEKWMAIYKKNRLEQIFKDFQLPEIFLEMFNQVSSAYLSYGEYLYNGEYNIHLESNYEPAGAEMDFGFWGEINGNRVFFQKPTFIIEIRYGKFSALCMKKDYKNERILEYREYKQDFFCSYKHFDNDVKKARSVLNVLYDIEYEELLDYVRNK